MPKTEITKKQYDSLLLWLSTCVSGNYVELFFEDGDYATYDLDETPADELIKIVKYYYRQGMLREDLKDEAKKYFGVVPEWQSSVGLYINTDGTILDGSGELLGNANGRRYGQRAVDHREISNIMSGSVSGDEAMLKYMSEGNIRWMPESPGCSMIKEPTQAQYATLSRLVSKNAPDGFYVDFVDTNGNNIAEEEFDFPRAVSVISAIKNHFSGKDKIEASKKRIEDLLHMPYAKALNAVARAIMRKLEDNDMYISVTGIDFTGSRRFGEPREDSDLDVRLTYESIGERCREDDVFNALNDEDDPLYLEGYKLDVNPTEYGDIEALIKRDSGFRKARESLTEETRNGMISKSRSAGQYKDQSRGKNRFDRRRYSKIAGAVKSYNQIDMNDFFKKDVLTVKIPVKGETDDYMVSIKLEGVCAEIAKNVKNNSGKFEFRTVVQALTKVFNTGNVYVNCTCSDFRYNFAH